MKPSSLQAKDVKRSPAHQDIIFCNQSAEAQAGGHLSEKQTNSAERTPGQRPCRAAPRRTLTACLAWMLADPSARMVLKIGFRVLNTSSLSMPEPSWMHKRQAREAAARCSSPLPGRNRSGSQHFPSRSGGKPSMRMDTKLSRNLS